MVIIKILEKDPEIFKIIEENNGEYIGNGFYYVNDTIRSSKILNFNLNKEEFLILLKKYKEFFNNYPIEKEVKIDIPIKILKELKEDLKFYNSIESKFLIEIINNITKIPNLQFVLRFINFIFKDEINLSKLLEDYEGFKILMDEKSVKVLRKLYFNNFKELYDLEIRQNLKEGLVFPSYPLLFKGEKEKLKKVLEKFSIKDNFYLYLISFMPHFFFYQTKKFNHYINLLFHKFFDFLIKNKGIFFVYEGKVGIITEKKVDSYISSFFSSFLEEFNLNLKDNLIFKGKEEIEVYFTKKSLLFLKNKVLIDKFSLIYKSKKSNIESLDRDLIYLKALISGKL